MTCLGSILMGPSTTLLEEGLDPVFNPIMEMLANDIPRIRRTTVWVATLMVTYAPRLVLNN